MLPLYPGLGLGMSADPFASDPFCSREPRKWRGGAKSWAVNSRPDFRSICFIYLCVCIGVDIVGWRVGWLVV